MEYDGELRLGLLTLRLLALKFLEQRTLGKASSRSIAAIAGETKERRRNREGVGETNGADGALPIRQNILEDHIRPDSLTMLPGARGDETLDDECDV